MSRSSQDSQIQVNKKTMSNSRQDNQIHVYKKNVKSKSFKTKAIKFSSRKYHDEPKHFLI